MGEGGGGIEVESTNVGGFKSETRQTIGGSQRWNVRTGEEGRGVVRAELV